MTRAGEVRTGVMVVGECLPLRLQTRVGLPAFRNGGILPPNDAAAKCRRYQSTLRCLNVTSELLLRRFNRETPSSFAVE
jgi:hypothetical protein